MGRFFAIFFVCLLLSYVVDVVILNKPLASFNTLAVWAGFATVVWYLQDILERLNDIQYSRGS